MPDRRRSVAVVATLTGAANYRQIGRREADLPQRLLIQLGAPYDYFRAAHLAPSESTIREVLTNVDADLLDLIVCAWLHECATRDRDGDLVIALDGKVLRGAWTTENTQVTLFAAMIHEQGVVVAQTLVPHPDRHPHPCPPALGIENRVHYVRDTAWHEDACRAHLGDGPRNLAILRNLALGLLRLQRVTKIKKTLEYIAGDRNRALQFLAT